MRVVQLVCSDGFAGVERFIANLSVGLAASGIEVTVIGGAEAPMRQALGPAGVAWLPGESIRQARRQLAALPAPDIIGTHMSEADLVGWLYRRSRRGRGAHLVSTRHFAAPRGGSAPARALFSRVRRGLDAQVSISAFVAENIDGSSEVIHTGVADQDPTGGRDRSVLVVQRLEPEKDTATAVRAWAASSARASGWRMSIVGDGSQREELEQLVDGLGVRDSVDFLGHRGDVDGLLARAGMVLAPTPREGLGLLVLEAMAAAAPVIASDTGGHIETVGAVTPETLFPPADAARAAAVIDRLARDEGERQRIGAALQRCQRESFSIPAQVRATLALYERLASR